MTEDARFSDGAERPLYLGAASAEDLEVISTLCQDAVTEASEMTWARAGRRFVILLNRFRWEDRENAVARGRGFERVQSMLSFESVLDVKTQGIDGRAEDTVLNLLSLSFEPGTEAAAPGGRIIATFSGDGALAVEVEAIDLLLKDVSRPYLARSGSAPDHDTDG